MKCREIQDRLAEGDRGVLDENGVREHVASCPDCKKELQRLEALDAALAKLPKVEPPSGVVARTMAAVEKRRAKRRRTEPGVEGAAKPSHRWRLAWILGTPLALAAVAIVLIGIFGNNMRALYSTSANALAGREADQPVEMLAAKTGDSGGMMYKHKSLHTFGMETRGGGGGGGIGGLNVGSAATDNGTALGKGDESGRRMAGGEGKMGHGSYSLAGKDDKKIDSTKTEGWTTPTQDGVRAAGNRGLLAIVGGQEGQLAKQVRDTGRVSVELKELEKRVDHLKDQTLRSKARLSMLQGDLAATQSMVKHGEAKPSTPANPIVAEPTTEEPPPGERARTLKSLRQNTIQVIRSHEVDRKESADKTKEILMARVSKPSSSVMVDGKLAVNSSPHGALAALAPGEHDVTVRRPGYKDQNYKVVASTGATTKSPSKLDLRQDLDGDGNADEVDKCPDGGKQASNNGCPGFDTDKKTGREAVVMGSLDKDIIRRVINSHRTEIAGCFQRQLKSDPNTHGKLAVNFIIDSSGSVAQVGPKAGELEGTELAGCVSQNVRGWKFPAPLGGGIVAVTYPFMFRSSGVEGEPGSEMPDPDEVPLSQLTFIPSRGYFSNTYLPGDPELDTLRRSLEQRLVLGGEAVVLEEASAPYRQPFDAPATDGLALYLNSDLCAVDGPRRITVQVGLKGSERHARSRAALNAALVVDLRAVPAEDARRALWTLADAMASNLQAGDRFYLVVAGSDHPLKIKPSAFEALEVRRTLAQTLETREKSGASGTLQDALLAAFAAVKGDSAGDTPLGADLVLLASAAPLGEDLETLSLLAHQQAVDGITLTTVGIGPDADVETLRELALAGQGRMRTVPAIEQARPVVEAELAATGSVVARALRLRIRLADGVKLVQVLGSHSLDVVESDRVRQAEKAIDQRVSKALGIAADRGEDEDGIQIVIPSFYAGDEHVILLDVVVPGPGPVADVRVRYKDLVNLSNAVAQLSLSLPPGQRPADPLARNVRKNVLAFHLSQALLQAAQKLDAGAIDEASAALAEAGLRIERAMGRIPDLADDSEVQRDIGMLAAYQRVLTDLQQGQGDDDIRTHLVYSLAYAGKVKLPPGTPR